VADAATTVAADTGAVHVALVAELELALAAARRQQALLRSSLTTVIAFLDRDLSG
jgi:hypothetical protein